METLTGNELDAKIRHFLERKSRDLPIKELRAKWSRDHDLSARYHPRPQSRTLF